MSTVEVGAPRSAEETARYIGTMARELRELAARDGLDFLAYLLAMVEGEAAASGRKPKGGGPP